MSFFKLSIIKMIGFNRFLKCFHFFNSFLLLSSELIIESCLESYSGVIYNWLTIVARAEIM
jgi:hypothetical protein